MTVARKGKALVVLAHGFLGGRVQFIPLASSLAQKYNVFNYGYQSRQDTLSGHAHLLQETVAERVSVETKAQGGIRPTVHFVTHSFGGVIVHRALTNGLYEYLHNNHGGVSGAQGPSRFVLIGPPLRGAALARAFQKDRLGGPDFVRKAVYTAATTIMGTQSGAELLSHEPEWFDDTLGVLPKQVGVLVVAGDWGRINPLIDDNSDGVVAVNETVMNRPHYRLHVQLTHNLMLYSREVRECIETFLDGQNVGELVDGMALRAQMDAASSRA